MVKQAVSVNISNDDISKIKENVLIAGFFKDKANVEGRLKQLDAAYGSVITSFIKDSNFKGDKNSVKSIYTNKSIKNIVLVGLGEEEKYSFDVLSSY